MAVLPSIHLKDSREFRIRTITTGVKVKHRCIVHTPSSLQLKDWTLRVTKRCGTAKTKTRVIGREGWDWHEKTYFSRRPTGCSDLAPMADHDPETNSYACGVSFDLQQEPSGALVCVTSSEELEFRVLSPCPMRGPARDPMSCFIAPEVVVSAEVELEDARSWKSPLAFARRRLPDIVHAVDISLDAEKLQKVVRAGQLDERTDSARSDRHYFWAGPNWWWQRRRKGGVSMEEVGESVESESSGSFFKLTSCLRPFKKHIRS